MSQTSKWAEKSEAIKTRLKLRTEPIAFRRLAGRR